MMPTDLLKFGRIGKPKWRKFHLTADLSTVEWSSRDKSKDTTVPIAKITKITYGQQTDKFRRLSRADVAPRSFSLWYADRNGNADTLDLVCTTESLFLTWTTAISALHEGTVKKEVLESIKKSSSSSANSLSVSSMQSRAVMSASVQSLKGKKKYEAALETANVVYGFGSNSWGQLAGKSREIRFPALIHLQGSENVTEIAAGWSHTTMLMSDGSVSQMGHKMATGLESDVSKPTGINFQTSGQIGSITCGRLHNALLTENGDIYTWGCNFFGQLGLGDTKDRLFPEAVQQVVELKTRVEVLEIDCGNDFTAAISANSVFTWGCGKRGALGHGDEKNVSTPRLVEGVRKPTGLACGAHHMLAWCKADKMLYSWGANGSGQLGLGDEKDGLRPAEVKTLSGLTVNCAAAGAAHTLVTTYGKEGSKTWAFGSNSCGQLAVGAVGDGAKITTPTPVPSLSRGLVIEEIACGSLHSLARSQGGAIWATGCNEYGQLGIDDKTKSVNRFTHITTLKEKNPRAIACGGMHSFVMCPKKWLKDDEVNNCMKCNTLFTFLNRRHHCRNCCGIFCNKCSNKRIAILALKLKTPQRVCEACYRQLGGR